MPPFLLGSIFGFPRWIWGIGAVVVLVAAVLIGIKVHDHRVIAAHEAAQRAKDAQASLEAERRANASAAILEAQRAERSTQAAKDMRDAEIAHPAEARQAAGPVARAAVNRLRRGAGQKHP
jgi:hypothetical protein